jgi:hypothetical protein
MANRRFTLGEVSMVVAEATQMVNSRPIARNTGNSETGGRITPLHMLLDRASVEVLRMKFDKALRLTQRLQFITEVKEQFWKKWMRQVFSGRMLSHKWVTTKRSVAVGDVVYLAEAENNDPTYRLGVVEEVNPGEDGCMRTVNIRYMNPAREQGKRSPCKITTRPIHKIVVIVPAGYVFEDDTGGGKVNLRRPRCHLGVKEEPEAAGIQERGPAQKACLEEPKKVESQPASRWDPGGQRSRPNRRQQDARSGENLSTLSKRDWVGLERSQQPASMRTQRRRAARSRPLSVRGISSRHRGEDTPGIWLPRDNRTEGEAARPTSPNRGSVQIWQISFLSRKVVLQKAGEGETSGSIVHVTKQKRN